MVKSILKSNKYTYIFIKKVKSFPSMLLPDKTFIKLQYKSKTGIALNLNDPKTFNEKIQWLKINYRNPLYPICADKFAVRNFVKERIGSNVLNDLYCVYKSTKEIDYNELPKSFVLKVTHGSGQNIIVQDKSTIDETQINKKLDIFMKFNHYYSGREWAYKNIPPRIVCEKYLDDNGKPPKDYKIFCFGGEPKIIQVDTDRFDEHKRSFYDIDWNKLNVVYKYKDAGTIDKPHTLNTMLEYAGKLSSEFPFVRVDFYEISDRVIFGEMTFYPENATVLFSPDEYNVMLGTYLKLPV